MRRLSWLAYSRRPPRRRKTFVASPSIPDTTATSACTSPCALRQAIAAAEAAEEAAVNGFKTETQTIELPVGTYTLTNGPLRIKHQYGGEPEGLTLTLQGLGAHADEVVITAEGKSRVLVDGDFGGTSGAVVLKRLEITGGNGEGGIARRTPRARKRRRRRHRDRTERHAEARRSPGPRATPPRSAGGGIEDVGELTVENSTIAHNTVTGGRAQTRPRRRDLQRESQQRKPRVDQGRQLDDRRQLGLGRQQRRRWRDLQRHRARTHQLDPLGRPAPGQRRGARRLQQRAPKASARSPTTSSPTTRAETAPGPRRHPRRQRLRRRRL